MRLDRTAILTALVVLGTCLSCATSERDARDPDRDNEAIPPGSGTTPSVPQQSADKNNIVFLNQGKIYSANTKDSSLNQIPDGPSAKEFFEVDETPSISPDGSRVAYSTFRYSTGWPWNRVHSYEIATSRLDGTDPRRLTKNKYRDRAPVWSSDGNRIAFVSRRTGSSPEIYTMSSGGSDVQHIGDGGRESYIDPKLAWSPDDRYIAFRDFDRGMRDGQLQPVQHFVAIVESDGSGLKRVFESDSWISDPAWSPKGQLIAFRTTEEDMTVIYVSDVQGSNINRVFSVPSPKVSPDAPWLTNDTFKHGVSWRPDGSEIRFIGYAPNFGLHSIKADGTGFRTLLEQVPTSAGWFVDGSRLIVYRTASAGDQDVVLYSIALDGTDRHDIVRQAHGALVMENSTRHSGPPSCSTGDAVPEPGKNPGLVQDCVTLLHMKDVLAGSDVELNWRAFQPITSRQGVIVGGSPPRVEGIEFTGTELRPNTYLSGSIPSGVADLSGLKRLVLGSQRLSGEIPPELGSFSKLERLIVVDNQLTGSIPRELGNLINLRDLVLTGNSLTGEIPPELGMLENLKTLAVHKNDLTGCIPRSLTDNPNLSIGSELKPC